MAEMSMNPNDLVSTVIWGHYCPSQKQVINTIGTNCKFCGVGSHGQHQSAPIQQPKFNFDNEIDNFSKAIATGLKVKLEQEIEEQLLAAVRPKIRETVAEVTEKVIQQISSHFYNDPATFDRRIGVSFNGEIFKKEQL